MRPVSSTIAWMGAAAWLGLWGAIGSADAADATTDPAIRAIDAFIAQQGVDKSDAEWKRSLSRPPKQRFNPARKYYWQLETDKGVLKIRLLADVAPMHVASTIYLTRLGYFDDTIFHRIIKEFMAQGGDPTGSGRGGPGYEYDGEFRPDVRHDKRGVLSMANAGPGTDGSQFFLTFGPTPHLDGKHTIFGEVVDGMEALARIEASGRHSGSPSHRPASPPRIRKAEILVE